MNEIINSLREENSKLREELDAVKKANFLVCQEATNQKKRADKAEADYAELKFEYDAVAFQSVTEHQIDGVMLFRKYVEEKTDFDLTYHAISFSSKLRKQIGLAGKGGYVKGVGYVSKETEDYVNPKGQGGDK